MSFRHGDADGAAEDRRRPAKGKRGTEVTFLPGTETFTMIDFDFATLEHRLRELAFLNSGVQIVLTDKRRAEPRRGADLRGRRSRRSCAISTAPSTADRQADLHRAAERDGISVEVALWWNDSYHENVLCFTNNIPQRDGGTHLAGFRGALTRVR